MKTILFSFLALFLLIGAIPAAARVTYTVSLNTIPLVNHPAGPFSLAFQLADGSSTGDENNAAVLSNFNFGATGQSTGTPKLVGEVSGDLSSTVVLIDSGAVNLFAQPFIPGDALTFTLTLSDNIDDGGIPDGFIFSILDSSGMPIPTLGGDPLNVFLAVYLDSESPTVQTFASDPKRSPAAGGNPIKITAPLNAQSPTISGLPAPGCALWPPNNKLVQVAVIKATDTVSNLASFDVSAVSNEPSNANDSDIVITGAGLEPRVVQLEAERHSVYTLTATATDLAGNVATSSATCEVRKRHDSDDHDSDSDERRDKSEERHDRDDRR